MGFKSGKVQVPLEMRDKQVRILPAGAGRLCNSEATEMKNSMVLFANQKTLAQFVNAGNRM